RNQPQTIHPQVSRSTLSENVEFLTSLDPPSRVLTSNASNAPSLPDHQTDDPGLPYRPSDNRSNHSIAQSNNGSPPSGTSMVPPLSDAIKERTRLHDTRFRKREPHSPGNTAKKPLLPPQLNSAPMLLNDAQQAREAMPPPPLPTKASIPP